MEMFYERKRKCGVEGRSLKWCGLDDWKLSRVLWRWDGGGDLEGNDYVGFYGDGRRGLFISVQKLVSRR